MKFHLLLAVLFLGNISFATAQKYWNKGNEAYENEDYRKALKYYYKARAGNMNNAALASNIAYCKLQLEDYIGALVEYNVAIKNDDSDPEDYYYRAEVNLNLKDYKSALSDINRAIKLEPDDEYYYALRAEIKLETNDYAGALSDQQKAVQLNLGKKN